MTPDRLARVRRRLADTSAEALVITDLTNVRWTSGFTGSNGWLVVGRDDATLVTDGRYADQAAAELHAHGCDSGVVVARSRAEQLERLAEVVGARSTLGFEPHHLTVAQHEAFGKALAPSLVAVSGLVEAERRSKDEHEVATIERACGIASEALAQVAPLLAQRPTEADVRDELDHRMRRLGADGPSYDTIVATGPAGASRPHHRPGPSVIEEGHTVVIDVGALVDGYHSDMTRTFLVGEPTALQQEVYDVVLAAQRAGVEAVRPGVPLAELDATCRDIITSAGFGPWFSHGTGHGVGLLIHEDPFVNATAAGTLQAGDVVTVEPGVYRVDLGGVRIEDLVLVTTDAHRQLTHFSKDPSCPPSPPTT